MATAEEIDNRRRSPRESVAPLPPSCHLADVENQLGPTFLTRYSLSSLSLSLSSSLARLCLYEKKREEELEEDRHDFYCGQNDAAKDVAIKISWKPWLETRDISFLCANGIQWCKCVVRRFF